MADENFYREVPRFSDFVRVCDAANYSQVPTSWDLVITDVEGSTKAIEEGRYKEVNAAGAASIVAIRNALSDIDLPFVFGGDGATLLTPASRRTDLEHALRGLRDGCKEAFSLRMRVGIVPLGKLHDAGHSISVARFASSEDMSFAMFRGSGIDEGERWVKDPVLSKEFEVSEDGPSSSNFEGFECRWRPIPSQHGLVASLIVKAMSPEENERVACYERVLREVASIVQNTNEGCPLPGRSLKLKKGKDGFTNEVALRSAETNAKPRSEILAKVRREVRNGKFLFLTKLTMGGFNPRKYKRELVANTDYRKFDNVLRMHLDLRRGQLDQIKQILQGAEDAGHLVYGIHTAKETLMTCVIDSYQGSHAHFVDGAHGGYALAAKRIKALLKES